MLTLSSQATSCCNRPAPVKRSLINRLLSTLGLVRSRRALAQLTPEQLADAGISRAQAINEANRPFWDAPDHWKL